LSDILSPRGPLPADLEQNKIFAVSSPATKGLTSIINSLCLPLKDMPNDMRDFRESLISIESQRPRASSVDPLPICPPRDFNFDDIPDLDDPAFGSLPVEQGFHLDESGDSGTVSLLMPIVGSESGDLSVYPDSAEIGSIKETGPGAKKVRFKDCKHLLGDGQ
jgi:hypothetical protein